MRTTTQANHRLAVFYDGAGGPTVYRIAVEIAAKAWDAGCSVRVRRLGDIVVPDGYAAHPEWIEMLSNASETPEAGMADLEWASVGMILSESFGQQTLQSLARRPRMTTRR